MPSRHNSESMAKTPVWHDEYWLLLLQLYLRKPVGVKALYSHDLVGLSLELHIPPQALRARMQQIAVLQTRRIEHFWNAYSKEPRRLARAVRLLRSMSGFGAADEFYEGVQVEETFEKDFRPIAPPSGQTPAPLEERLTPVMLILILNLYFQLTPSTMVTDTPEIQQLARMLKLSPKEVVHVMDVYQACDPYLNRDEMILSPLLLPCQQQWQRFGNHEPTELEAFAEQLKEYFK